MRKIILAALLSILFPASIFAQQTIDPRLLPPGVPRQMQVDGTNLTGNDPVNIQQSTDIDPSNPSAGIIQWIIRPAAVTDSHIAAGGITTRSKLPGAIAYEDEANTFGGAVSIGGTGSFSISGSTSGTITIGRQAAAGTYNFNLPTSAGTSGQPLLSGGGGASPMTFGTLGFGGGGTGATSFTGNRCIRSNAGGTAFEVAPGDCGTATVDQAGSFTWTGPHTWRDNNFTILDNTDPTKGIRFELTGVTAGQTRLLTPPNASTNLLGGTDIGTTVQGYSANLDSLATVASTAFGRSLLDDADAAAGRTTLGVPAASGTVLTGAFSLSASIRPPSLTADQNNYNPTGCGTASVIFLDSTAPRNITGLDCTPSAGRTIMIFYYGANSVNLVNNSGSSTANFRFAFSDNITLSTNQGIIIQYDSDASALKWRAASGISGGALTGTFTGLVIGNIQSSGQSEFTGTLLIPGKNDPASPVTNELFRSTGPGPGPVGLKYHDGAAFQRPVLDSNFAGTAGVMYKLDNTPTYSILAPTDDTVLVGNGSVHQAKVLPTCRPSLGSSWYYDAPTNTWGCESIVTSGLASLTEDPDSLNAAKTLEVGVQTNNVDIRRGAAITGSRQYTLNRNVNMDVAGTTGTLTSGNCARFNADGVLVNAGSCRKVVQVELFGPGQAVSTGDGKAYFRVPTTLNGMNLVAVTANVLTAGTTGTTNVDIDRCAATTTGNVCTGTVSDMLTTNLTIDSGENDSATAAATVVINTANDDVITGQILRINVDAVQTTAPQGLIVNMEFELP
jgi:hypothetical protein